MVEEVEMQKHSQIEENGQESSDEHQGSEILNKPSPTIDLESEM